MSLIIESINENIDPLIKIVVEKNLVRSGGETLFQIGQNFLEYNENFRFFLVSYEENAHFSPELLSKVCLLNFTITPEAIRDQMLCIVMKEEDPILEEEKMRILNDNRVIL